MTGIRFGRSLSFRVDGEAAPQGSKTPGRRRDGSVYLRESSGGLKAWRRAVEVTGRAVARCEDWDLLAGPVYLEACFYRERPASWPKKRTLPSTKPDLDKLSRAIGDALEGVLYRNDSQITDLVARKRCGSPGCEISVRELLEAAPCRHPIATQREQGGLACAACGMILQ